MSTRQGWRNRIVGHGEEAPDQLLANPRNWRLHPKGQQEALAGVLGEVGWVQDVIVNRTTGHVVDGHARVSIAISRREPSVPVVYVELSPEEEAKVLATFDPLGAMAGADREQLGALIEDVATRDGAVQALLNDLTARSPLPGADAWTVEEDWSDPEGDGIEAQAGYRLSSIWYGMTKANDARKHMLDLPPRPDAHDGATVKLKYSRTNPEETERIVRTYMRPGDRFFEMCCGWMTFSSTAKFLGYSGRGGDIWPVSLDFCRRQLEAMPGAGRVDVVRADCTATGEPPDAYDFVHSNPPFFSLEPYGDSPDDLASLGSYDRWLEAMGRMGAEAERILRPGGLANFVINDYRRDGVLVPMHADFVSAVLGASGLVLHDLVVAEVLSQALRFRRHDHERRRTVKCHEYVLTFRKPGGDDRAS